MDVLSTPRFLLSGVRSGVGKTLIAIGLAVALRKRKVGLSCCIVGSDVAEALVLKRLSRRYVRALDTHLLTSSQILASVCQASIGADLLMIEGNAGLYDGFSAGSLRGSDAEIAALTKTPVVLIADAKGYGNSLAALLSGYLAFAKGFSIAGMIATRTASIDANQDHLFYDAVMQSFSLQKLLGVMPEMSTPLPQKADRFSQARVQGTFPLQFFVDLGHLVSQHIDIDRCIEIAQAAEPLVLRELDSQPMMRKTRIAVSEDNCFSVGFQDNLDLLRFYGAELVAFSPLADRDLPKRIGAVYLTGAALLDYGEELSKNESLMTALKNFADRGGVIYTEGAGTAYICGEFQGREDNQWHQGVGIVPGRALTFDGTWEYVELSTIEESILGAPGQIVKGVNTAEWRLENSQRLLKTLRISQSGSAPVEEGYSPGAQIAATFSFPHWASNPVIAKNVVEAAEIVCKI